MSRLDVRYDIEWHLMHVLRLG